MIERELRFEDVGRRVRYYTEHGSLDGVISSWGPFGMIHFLQDGLRKYTITISKTEVTFLPPHPEPETKGMNHSTAILLMNERVRVIEAIYERDGKADGHNEEYKAPRELFKTFDETVAKDMLVTVPSGTRHGVTVVKVTDINVDWDADTTKEIKWIIGIVDMAHFEKMKALDVEMYEAINAAEKADRMNKMREKLVKNMTPEQQAAIASMADKAAATLTISHDASDTKR